MTTSVSVHTDNALGLLKAFALFQQSALNEVVFYTRQSDEPSRVLPLQALTPWLPSNPSDASASAQLASLVDSLECPVLPLGYLTLDIAHAKQAEQAEAANIDGLDVMDNKAWPTIEPRLQSEAGLTIWQPNLSFVDEAEWIEALLSLFQQQEIPLKTSLKPPGLVILDDKNTLFCLSEDDLKNDSKNREHSALWQVWCFYTMPGFLRHAVTINQVTLLPKPNGGGGGLGASRG